MKWIIDGVIEFSIRNRFIVFAMLLGILAWGLYCISRTPVDAIPDLSENQVIVWADWPGRSPKEVEDQITYPLSSSLQGLAGVKAVRATSEFGFSMINVIFEDEVDFYFARQRVLERLSTAGSILPQGVVPYMAPDATALGQIFWYTVEGDGKSLDELRALQDSYVRTQLGAVPGVSQVASVGGFVREYQVDVDPEKLRAYGVTLGQVFNAVQTSNSSVGGKVVQKGGAEYLVRGQGWVRDAKDLESIVVEQRRGVPITVGSLGAVQLGPAFRRNVLDKNGRDAVGGVVMMRFGENPLEVTRRVKEKIRLIAPGLPKGVRIVPFYDRTPLIEAAIDTLRHTLIEEILIVSVIVLIVLWHVRSAFIICVTMPISVVISFILMYYFRIPSNIMSLSGIAIAIGALIDAGIVMTENAYNTLHEKFGSNPVTGDTRDVVAASCKVVGAPLFFSVLIMILSFLPVFVLGGMEGRMFNPLAWTKTFALVGVAVLCITLVPALIPSFVRGRLRSQEEVWIVRSFLNVYRPMLEFFIRRPDVIVVITGALLLLGLPIFPRKVPWTFFIVAIPFIVAGTVMTIARHRLVCMCILFIVAAGAFRFFKPVGEEFMPPLDELAIMDMPVTTPNVNITQVSKDLRARDVLLQGFPEVHQVVGKAGRAETPTDPAPIDMVESVVSLRKKDRWPHRKIEFGRVLEESKQVREALESRGVLRSREDRRAQGARTAAGESALDEENASMENAAAMDAVTKFDRSMRELSARRLREHVPQMGRELARLLRIELMNFLRDKGALKREPSEVEWAATEDSVSARFAERFAEWILAADVAEAASEVVDALAAMGAVESDGGNPPRAHPELLVEQEKGLQRLLAPLRVIIGERPPLLDRIRSTLEEREHDLAVARVRSLNWEIQDTAHGAMVWFLIEEVVAKARERSQLARTADAAELHAVRDLREKAFHEGLYLWPKEKSDLVKEMDSELQVPGWGNIWTQPIINRVDMLATGVRTMIGVKVFGEDLDTVQRVTDEIAVVLRKIRGAVDVFPDQIVGENYLEIDIRRDRLERYGVSVEDVQNVIEVALGGKEVTTKVEGRRRFPIRVRYPREWREDEDRVKDILIPARGLGGAPGGAPVQIPLSQVADVRVVTGPSMIKSEDGRLRAYVQLNVRDRDIVGFVEEAQAAVASKVKLPQGVSIAWSGQFEHQRRAQRTLSIVFPAVILVIFLILYLTYRDFADTLMMFLSVPGAIAGAAIFQLIWGHNFSVAVWVGFIAIFGMAAETGVVMLVYLREAIERAGGMENIRTEREIFDAVMNGAVKRLRPKLLTEGATIIALTPMLWATGVGAEFMGPMAVPILGGTLVADEVIDIFLPVLFYHDRCRRLRKRLKAEALLAEVSK